jgi:hypothetical protein
MTQPVIFEKKQRKIPFKPLLAFLRVLCVFAKSISYKNIQIEIGTFHFEFLKLSPFILFYLKTVF